MVPCYGASGPNPTGQIVESDGIMHAAWAGSSHRGRSLWFWPTVADTEVASILPVGTRMRLYTAPPGSYSPYIPA